MGSCTHDGRRHACECQQRVGASTARGVALQTESPSVGPRLSRAFRESPNSPGVYIADGDGFAARVRNAIEPCSQMERRSVRAAPIGPDGAFDAWAAGPVDDVLARIETPWLPELLNAERFRFLFQPIVESGTLAIHGFESLIRAEPPFDAHGPGEMIDAAKAHGALLKFDQAARKNAILQGVPKLEPEERLFVNFFPMTVYDPEVCLRTTIQAAHRIGADVSRLVFEVVESEQFPDIAHLRAILSAYRKAGARVALDDLGSGNTAMTYIDELEPDYVKIDKHIVKQASERRQFSLLHGMVRHAQQNGITVIAEGIETPHELDLMRGLGVELVQGYLIAKPGVNPQRIFDVASARAA